MTTSQHQQAIAENNAQFNKDFVKVYEKQEAQKLHAILFVKHLLEYDFANPTKRKTDAESEPILGDPKLPVNGFSIESTLPDPKTYLVKYPHSIFKPGMKLLDFACGPGLVTELFVPYLKGGEQSELYGIDVSPSFIELFNKRASQYSSPDLDFRSFLYDIVDETKQDELNEKFANRFDAIICTIAYHHLDSYQLITKKLATFLKPGGWLFIIDFYNEDVEKADENDTSKAVDHMRGLKISSLNSTLRDFGGLVNVTSAREFRTCNWFPEKFICSHSNQDTIQKFENGEFESKEFNGVMNYLIEISLIYAVGQRGKE